MTHLSSALRTLISSLIRGIVWFVIFTLCLIFLNYSNFMDDYTPLYFAGAVVVGLVVAYLITAWLRDVRARRSA